MATNRPVSLIIPPGVFDATDSNNISKQKSPVLPEHSSSSSVDSNSGKNAITNTKPSIPQTTSSTPSDSDLESGQDDNLPTRRQKTDINSQEHLSRREKQFQKLFKTEISDDMPNLIDSYVCAYQGDILLQGKLYITDRYLCFHSRILSYVTKHVYRWEQIGNVSKERVAFIFPTAIGIQLKQTGKKITYASFLLRDQAYDKILSVCSRSSNNTTSFDDNDDDDDDNEITQDGTLKAINNYEKRKYRKVHSYDVIDAPEQDEVLQMCLKDNKNDKGRLNSISSKGSDEKQPEKTLMNSHNNKKTSGKSSNVKPKLSNGLNGNISNTNQPVRHSRYSKNEQKQKETTKKNNSVINQRSLSTSLKPRQSQSNDLRSSTMNQILPHTNSSSTLTTTTNIDSSIKNSNDNGVLTKILNIIISLLNILVTYLSSLFHHFKTYPTKTTIIILLFFLILFFHSFYLIKLTYRIENRLQSLHYAWPTSSIKNSFSSSKEL